MSDQRKPPLCDQHPWNHIRHRCCCVFDHDSDEAGPIAECFYHEKIRAERDEAVALLREVSETGGLANDLVRDRVDAFLAKVKP